ncbi:hypothetical protein E4T56_gene12057 [Termitomyces sp. T112]|nr:hypothetical protein E4T56_gene12057 [Termitomyces sp. T112]
MVATDALAEESQLAVDKQLGSIVDCPILADDVIRSVVETLDSQHPRSSVNKSGSLNVDTSVSKALMRSNHRPTPIQMSHIRSRLEEKNLELLDMDYDILRLQLKINESVATMNALIKSRLQKQKEADSCQIWLSHARLLPLDIIIRILKFATSNVLGDRLSPLELSHVCSSWREAAITCSSLWNDLELVLSSFWPWRSSDPATQSNAVNSVIALWFGRANSFLPLTLSIIVRCELKLAMGEGVARGVLPFSSRVNSLYFEISKTGFNNSSSRGFEAMAPFLKLPAGTFPSLEDLTFIDWTPQKTDEVVPRITVFDFSPRLRRIILRAQPWWFKQEPSLVLPWAQLTHLEVGGVLTTSSFADVIFQCRQLQKAIFCYVEMPIDGDEPPSLPEKPVTFPHLVDLKLGLSGPDLIDRNDINTILSLILLPAVEKLALSHGTPLLQLFPYHGFPVLALVPLPGGTFPPLRRLMLSFADIDLEELLRLLNGCPLLEKLSLCLKSIAPELLLKALTRAERSQSEATAPLLSHLKSFAFAAQMENLEQSEDVNSVVSAFGDLVASWVSRHHPLSDVFLCLCDLRVDGDLHRTIKPEREAQFKEAILHQIGDDSQIEVFVELTEYTDLSDLFDVVDPVEWRKDNASDY